MEKIQVGRQKIEGTDAVRLYHTRLLLSKKILPIIQGNVIEVTHWAWLQGQRELSEMSIAGNKSNDPLSAAIFDDSQKTKTHPVIEAISALEGVAYVIPSGYSVVVIKAKQFEWEEFETSILRLLSTFQLELPSTLPEEGVIIKP